MRMSPPGCSFSLEIYSAMLPLMSVELFHSAFLSVVETTYLGRLFILSAKPPSPGPEGQNTANIW